MAYQFPNIDPALPYLNPTHVRAFIGDVWLDDVVSVGYQVQDERRPIFGFKSQHYDVVSHGRTLVTGQLLSLFRYPGYLSKVLTNLLSRDPGPRGVSTAIPISPNNMPADASTFLTDLSKRGPAALSRYSETFKSAIWDGVVASPRSRRASDIQTEERRSFDLRLIYNRIDQTETYTFERILEGVHLMGESQEISIIDGLGDQCIYESYNFIARNVHDSTAFFKGSVLA